MRQWLLRSDHEIRELDDLNIVHVAGTKGKGSTCAFVNSILTFNHSAHGIPRKIGFYTSPHLLHVREMIRINSTPISEAAFTHYLFEVWDALEASAAQEGREHFQAELFPILDADVLPHFSEKKWIQQSTRLELAVRGTRQIFIGAPAAMGITALGINHVAVLGDTSEQIAWLKSGIFKQDVAAFLGEQVEAAAGVLRQRVAEKHAPLQFIGLHPVMSQLYLTHIVNGRMRHLPLFLPIPPFKT